MAKAGIKRRPYFKSFWVQCILYACILLALYGAYAMINNPRDPVPVHAIAASNSNCPLSDKTFCNTDQQYRSLVNALDFSDILENQASTSITCTSAVQLQAYCRGIQNGLILRLYTIHQGQSSKLVTRNQYLAFFRTYFAQNGPMAFTSDSAAGSSMTMHFANANRSAQYLLTFDYLKTSWTLTSVAVTSP